MNSLGWKVNIFIFIGFLLFALLDFIQGERLDVVFLEVVAGAGYLGWGLEERKGVSHE